MTPEQIKAILETVRELSASAILIRDKADKLNLAALDVEARIVHLAQQNGIDPYQVDEF